MPRTKEVFIVDPEPKGKRPFRDRSRVNLIIDGQGNIHNPRWVTNHETTEDIMTITHRLTWPQTKVGVPATIRQIDHTIARYQKEDGEIQNLGLITEQASELWHFFVGRYDREHYHAQINEICKQLAELAISIGRVEEPRKVQALQQIATVAQSDGKDRTGRNNPSAMSARLISALSNFEDRELGIGNIISDLLMRKKALQYLRYLCLRKLKKVREIALETLGDPAFFSNEYQSEEWLADLKDIIWKIKRLSAKSKIGVQPYLAVGQAIQQLANPCIPYCDNLLHLKVRDTLRKMVQLISVPDEFDSLVCQINMANDLLTIALNNGNNQAETRGLTMRMINRITEALSAEPYQPIWDDVGEALYRAVKSFDQNQLDKMKQAFEKAISRLDW